MTPFDLAIEEARKRSLDVKKDFYSKGVVLDDPALYALAKMIEKYEPELLVSPDILAVRELMAVYSETECGDSTLAARYLAGDQDGTSEFRDALRGYLAGKASREVGS